MARHFGIKEKEQHLLFNPMFSFTFLYFCVTWMDQSCWSSCTVFHKAKTHFSKPLPTF